SFILGVVVFRNPWGLVSVPTLNLAVIAVFAASGYLVSRGHIVQAAWIVIITFLLAAAGGLVILGQTNLNDWLINGMPLFPLGGVLAARIRSRRSVWKVTLISVLRYGLAGVAVPAHSPRRQDFAVVARISTSLVLIPLLGATLYR